MLVGGEEIGLGLGQIDRGVVNSVLLGGEELIDGVAASTAVEPRKVDAPRRVRVRDGVLRAEGVDEVELRTLTGSVAGRVRMRQGEGRMPSVPTGVYTVASAESGASLGFVTVW